MENKLQKKKKKKKEVYVFLQPSALTMQNKYCSGNWMKVVAIVFVR